MIVYKSYSIDKLLSICSSILLNIYGLYLPTSTKLVTKRLKCTILFSHIVNFTTLSNLLYTYSTSFSPNNYLIGVIPSTAAVTSKNVALNLSSLILSHTYYHISLSSTPNILIYYTNTPILLYSLPPYYYLNYYFITPNNLLNSYEFFSSIFNTSFSFIYTNLTKNYINSFNS